MSSNGSVDVEIIGLENINLLQETSNEGPPGLRLLAISWNTCRWQRSSMDVVCVRLEINKTSFP